MSEIKNTINTIITISGEPASGKSTVIKSIKRKYEEMGYVVHIEPIGQYWREAAVETYKRLKPEKPNPTIDEIHADPDFETFRKEIDLALDERVRKRGEEINAKARENEVFIFDSRLAWQNIPSSYAVRLTVDERTAGLRVFNDKKRGTEDQYPSEEAAIEATKIRKEEEIKRYKKRYGVDLTNQANYDLIVDTSFSNIEELAEIIIDGEKSYRKGITYPKMWASPLTFLSEQNMFRTYDSNVRELVEKIKEQGFNPSKGMVDIAENEGVKILLNGNHRACAMLSIGKTLLPYLVTHKDDVHSQNIAKSIYDDPTLECLYDWADIINGFGGRGGKITCEEVRDLKYLKGVKSLKDFKVQHLLAVSKVPKLRKKLGLDMNKEQNGEDR